MAVMQSTYLSSPVSGYAGMVANGELSNRISRTVDDATIGFGVPVFQGSKDHSCTATSAAIGFLGFTIANYASPPVQATGVQADTYTQGSTAGIESRGPIWVVTTVAVTPRQPVYVTPGGAITNVSAGNYALPNWEFDQTAAANGLVLVVKR